MRKNRLEFLILLGYFILFSAHCCLRYVTAQEAEEKAKAVKIENITNLKQNNHMKERNTNYESALIEVHQPENEIENLTNTHQS